MKNAALSSGVSSGSSLFVKVVPFRGFPVFKGSNLYLPVPLPLQTVWTPRSDPTTQIVFMKEIFEKVNP